MSKKQQAEMHPKGLLKHIIAVFVFLEMSWYKTTKKKVGSFVMIRF